MTKKHVLCRFAKQKVTTLVAMAFLFFVNLELSTVRAATSYIWTGAGGNLLFSNPGNWQGSVAPAAGTVVQLTFPPAGTAEARVDLANLTVERMTVTRRIFTLSGVGAGTPVTVNVVDLNAATNVVFAESIPLKISPTNLLNDTTYFFSSNGIVQLLSPISGTNVLTLTGGATFVLGGSQANTFSGELRARCGLLRLAKPTGVNATSGDLIVRYYTDLLWESNEQLPNTGTTLEIQGAVGLVRHSGLNGHTESVSTLKVMVDYQDQTDFEMEGGTFSAESIQLLFVDRVRGGALTLRGELIVLEDSSTHIDVPISVTVLARGNTIRAESSDLVLQKPISGPSGATVRFQSPGFFSTIWLEATNTYSGLTIVDGAALVLNALSPFGTTNNGTILNPGSFIWFGLNTTFAEAFTFISSPTNMTWLSINGPGLTNVVLSGPITLNNVTTLDLDSTENLLNFSGPISGNGGLYQSGYGTVHFTGTASNSFTGGYEIFGGLVALQRTNQTVLPGPVTVSYGVVRSFANNQIGDSAVVELFDGGTWDLLGFTDTIASLQLTGGSFTSSFGLQVNSNIVAHASSVASVINGKLTLGGSGVVVDVESGSFNPELRINAVISGGLFSPLTKIGTGRLELWGANTYGGATVVNEGVLALKNSGTPGGTSSGTSVSGGVLELATASSVHGEALTLNGGTLRLNNLSTNTWGGPVVLGGLALVETYIVGTRMIFTNIITGSGGFGKLGDGTMELSGTPSNNYAGYTYVGGGTLVLNRLNGPAVSGEGVVVGLHPVTFAAAPGTLQSLRAAQVADLTPVALTSAGTWNLNGFNDTIGLLQGSGTVNLGAATLTLGNSGVSSSWDGLITGNGSISLVKVGAGTLTMSGVQTYSGRTTVSAGTLIVNGTVGPGLTTISGGTLGGRGQVGNVTAMGGTISPGTSPGILKIGNFIGSANLTYRCELNNTNAGTGHDQLSVTGTVNLGQSPLQLVLGNPGAVSNRYTILVNDGTDAITSTFYGLSEGATFYANGTPFRITYAGGTGNDVVITQLGLQTKPQIGAVKKLPNGNMEINGTGIPNLLYTVYASTNIISTNWVDLGFIEASPAGALQFVDTDAALYSKRFYQFVLPPFNQ